MPRYRTTHEGAATIVGKLLILIAEDRETSATLAEKLGVSARQVNRYVRQLIEAGWQIERVGAWTKQDYYFALRSPKISVSLGKRKVKPAGRKRKDRRR
jgi:biotin operon repressor